MKTVGVICEYNPFHLGHLKQFKAIAAQGGEAIVCLMSGNYVQRGAPAVFHKSLRAQAAVRCGADLVMEMPITSALSSAEGFAQGGVSILGRFCTHLCFGAETPSREQLMDTAAALLSPAFSPALRQALEQGCSFPAARAAALEAMGLNSHILASPNNILAVEYCKAILTGSFSMEPMPIHRSGDYHDPEAQRDHPSATAVRSLMVQGGDWTPYVPPAAREVFTCSPIHTLGAGERAILARLRTMTEEEFACLPYGSEGLWRKLMHASRQENRLEEIACAVKSKRYTRTRIDRMILCAFLGLTARDLTTPAPYARVLAFNHKGREILKAARETGTFPNMGEKTQGDYALIEARAEALYGLFCQDAPEGTARNRVYSHCL